jgi:hypothetical protein
MLYEEGWAAGATEGAEARRPLSFSSSSSTQSAECLAGENCYVEPS